MSQILRKRCNFALRWLAVLENTSLEQNLRLKTLGYLLFIPAIFYLLLVCPMANFWLLLRKQSQSSDVSHCFWVINFWSKGDSDGLVTECPVEFDHNGITHLATHPKLQKIFSPDLHPDFPICGNAPDTQNSYSLTLWWALGLHNTSLYAKFSAQNFSFC